MVAKLTTEEVQRRLRESGFELVYPEKYVNSRTKIAVKCHCGKVFDTMVDSIFMNKTKSCGHCNDPEVGDKFGKLTIAKVIPSSGGGCKAFCKCDCGNTVGPISFKCVNSKNTKSCGKCNVVNIGDRYGKLEVVMVFYATNKSASIVCQCDCGRDTKLIKNYQLLNSNNRSCGKCGNQISNVVRYDLLKMLKQIFSFDFDEDKVLEQKIVGWKGCADILINNVVIEYDGYYWHRFLNNTKSTEKIKEKHIFKNGYKLIRIRSNGLDIPTIQQLKYAFSKLKKCQKWTITLKSWKNARKKHLTNNSSAV